MAQASSLNLRILLRVCTLSSVHHLFVTCPYILCSTNSSTGYSGTRWEFNSFIYRPDKQTPSQWAGDLTHTCSVKMQYIECIAIFKMSSKVSKPFLVKPLCLQTSSYATYTRSSIVGHKIDSCIISTPFSHPRFVSLMPTPMLFTVFSFLLRVVEGTGTAMYTTVSYTLLTQFYPEKKDTIVVSDFTVEPH